MDFSGWTPLDVAGLMRRADLSAMGTGRAGGVHVGQCVHAAKVAAGESVEAPEGDQEGVRIQEGFLWETILEYRIAGLSMDEAIGLAFKRYALSLRSHIVKQVSVRLDGVTGTPDAIDPLWPGLESYKATRRSLRYAREAADFEEQFWTWHMQEKAYLKMSGLMQVRWIAWWLAGDYSRGKGTGPQVLTATARYTQEELDANWRGVVTIAKRIEAEAGA